MKNVHFSVILSLYTKSGRRTNPGYSLRVKTGGSCKEGWFGRCQRVFAKHSARRRLLPSPCWKHLIYRFYNSESINRLTSLKSLRLRDLHTFCYLWLPFLIFGYLSWPDWALLCFAGPYWALQCLILNLRTDWLTYLLTTGHYDLLGCSRTQKLNVLRKIRFNLILCNDFFKGKIRTMNSDWDHHVGKICKMLLWVSEFRVSYLEKIFYPWYITCFMHTTLQQTYIFATKVHFTDFYWHQEHHHDF